MQTAAGKNVLSSEVHLYRTSELLLNEGEVFSLHMKKTNKLHVNESRNMLLN